MALAQQVQHGDQPVANLPVHRSLLLDRIGQASGHLPELDHEARAHFVDRGQVCGRWVPTILGCHHHGQCQLELELLGIALLLFA
jgi:hypothetical protein